MDTANTGQTVHCTGFELRQIHRSRVADGNLDDLALTVDIDSYLTVQKLGNPDELFVDLTRRDLPDWYLQFIKRVKFCDDIGFYIAQITIDFHKGLLSRDL